MRTRRLGAICAVLLLAVAACSSPESSADSTIEGSVGELQGTDWVLQSYATDGALTTVPDDQYANAEFTAGRVKGFGGCNQYDAIYRTGGRMLLVGVPATTLMACGETASAFESAYLTALEASRFYDILQNKLTIRGADRVVLLQFDAAPLNPLLGSWVVDSYATAPNSVVAPLPGTEMTAVFRFTTVGGSAGCNTYQGPYSLIAGAVAIGPLATTRIACPDDVMAQETAFLAAMQGVARVESRGQTLQLQDRDGRLVVALVRPSAVEPSPSPSAAPTAKASASPSASPSVSPSPTAKPTASPSPTPTPSPTASPTPPASASAAPTIQPPPSIPPLAQCTIPGASGATALATISYPSAWHTVTAPPNLACRYFDPNPITVPPTRRRSNGGRGRQRSDSHLCRRPDRRVEPNGLERDHERARDDLGAAGDPPPGDVDGRDAGRAGRIHALWLPDRCGRPPGLDRDRRDRRGPGLRQRQPGRRRDGLQVDHHATCFVAAGRGTEHAGTAPLRRVRD